MKIMLNFNNKFFRISFFSHKVFFAKIFNMNFNSFITLGCRYLFYVLNNKFKTNIRQTLVLEYLSLNWRILYILSKIKKSISPSMEKFFLLLSKFSILNLNKNYSSPAFGASTSMKIQMKETKFFNNFIILNIIKLNSIVLVEILNNTIASAIYYYFSYLSTLFNSSTTPTYSSSSTKNLFWIRPSSSYKKKRHLKENLDYYSDNLISKLKEYLEDIPYGANISRPTINLNLGLIFRFESISKLNFQKKNLFIFYLSCGLMRQVLDKKFKNVFKNSSIEYRENISPLNSLAISSNLSYLYWKKQFILYVSLAINLVRPLLRVKNRLINLFSNLVRSAREAGKNKNSHYPLKVRSGKNLNNYSLLGGNSIITLIKSTNSQMSLSLINPRNLYSTKTPKNSRDQSVNSINYPLLNLKARSGKKTKVKDRLNSPKLNYIKGWRKFWLRKLRFIEMLDKYNLNANDKLLLRILKERKNNLNKKMYQVLKKKKFFTHSKFSSLGKSRDLFQNQFIHYKFNKSKAKLNNFSSFSLSKIYNTNLNSQIKPTTNNTDWKEPYLKIKSAKTPEIYSSLPSLFNLWNWPGKEKFSRQETYTKTPNIPDIEVEAPKAVNTHTLGKSKFNYLSLFYTCSLYGSFANNLFFLSPFHTLRGGRTSTLLNRNISDPSKIKPHSLIMENLYKEKNRKVEYDYKIENVPNHLNKLEVDNWREAGKTKKLEVLPLPLLFVYLMSDLDFKQKLPDTNTQGVFGEIPRQYQGITEQDISYVGHFHKTKSWIGYEYIDIISLENLLKSFFKKMYSLISLPIFEYLPNKLNIRLFYYLKKNAKTYYSSTNIINSNIRSIVGINLRLPQKKNYAVLARSGKNKNNKKITILREDNKKYGPEILPFFEENFDKYFSLRFKTEEVLSDKNINLHRERERERETQIETLPLLSVNLNMSDQNKQITEKDKQRNKLIDELTRVEPNQLRSRSMQIISLKNFWSNVLNPSFFVFNKWKRENTKKDYFYELDNLTNLFQGYYNSNLDALVTESNPLKLNLFSKWRGESGPIEYQTKLNRNTRFLQDKMTIKEAILFSNPLLKEILDSQSLIYPNRKTNKQVNERLALFYNPQDSTTYPYGHERSTSTMTFFNETVKNIQRAGQNYTPFGLGLGALLSGGKLKLINPWQSIVPIKLNTLNKDFIKNGIYLKNSKLKNIFNRNLAKLNLMLFLVKLKEFTYVIQNKSPFTKDIKFGLTKYAYRKKNNQNLSSNSRSNFLNKFNIAFDISQTLNMVSKEGDNLYQFSKSFVVDEIYKSITQSNLELKLYKYTKRFKIFPITRIPSIFTIVSSKILRFKEINEDKKALDNYSFNYNQKYQLKNTLWPEIVQPEDGFNLSELLASPDKDREIDKTINLGLKNKISVTKNISVNYLSMYTLYKMNYFFNLDELDLESSKRKVKFIDPSNLVDKLKYVFSFPLIRKPYIHKLTYLSNRRKDLAEITDTKALFNLEDLYKNIRTSKFFSPFSLSLIPGSRPSDSSVITIFSKNYRKIDREIDNPYNNKSKGLVSYNKILFKKLLVYLKLLFNKEIELDLTRIKNPYNDVHILNQILGEVIKYKSNSFYRLTEIIRENANIKPKFISELDANAHNKNHPLLAIFPEPLDSSLKVNLNNENSFYSSYGQTFWRKDRKLKLIQGKSLYDYLFFPISFSKIKREELKDSFKIDTNKINTLYNSDIEKDKYISSYNCIALDKWSNFNQLNKQKKIYKQRFLDLKGLGLDNQLSNKEFYIKTEKERYRDRDSSKNKGINIFGELINNTTEVTKKKYNFYTNWRNLRNNFNLSFRKEITSEIIKENLMKTEMACSYNQTRKQTIKDNFQLNTNKIPSNLSTLLDIDYNLETMSDNTYTHIMERKGREIKKNKLMTYKMLGSLTNVRKKLLITLSDLDISLFFKKILKPNNNKEFIPINSKKIFTNKTETAIKPISVKPYYLERDIRKLNTLNKDKVNLIHSNISGIKFKLGGRLEKTTIIPRKSSQEVLIGNMSRGSTSFKNSSRLTYKNKRGAYSITVSTSYFKNESSK